MALTLANFVTKFGGYYDVNVVADGTGITATSGGTQTAIVLPAAIAAATNPVEALVAAFLEAYRRAAVDDNAAQAAEAIQVRFRPADSDRQEVTWTIKLEVELSALSATLAAAVEDYTQP